MNDPRPLSAGMDIAVVGMAARYPGAENVQEYWENLINGVETVHFPSDAELVAAGVDPDTLANPSYVKAYATPHDIDMWDAPFFGFNPKEASIMDPQHRLFLECAWEALEDAGHPPARFSGAIGVYAGCGMQSYFVQNLAPNQELMNDVGYFLVRHTGNDKDFLATRVSYVFDLRGPSMNIQTACSTSLVAIHAAAQSILAGECDMALAGAVSIEIPNRHGYLYKEGEVASPDGHTRAFDAASGGTVFGSGCGIVVLRRLEDAIADRDRIYAVIRGSAVNNDGASKVGYLAPSVEGQSRAAIEALAVAEADPTDVEMLEAHGTGTPVGDPIEMNALMQAYAHPTASQWCATGSVKTNMGHLDTAAGVASFQKAVLALDNQAIPASLHFKEPNPEINFRGSPFYVAAAAQPWPRRDTPRLAAVNSLGVGGTNAHVIVQEPPWRSSSSVQDTELILLSARTPSALNTAAGNLADHLEENEPALGDVAFTLREGRHYFKERCAVVARSVEEAVERLRSRGSATVTRTAPNSEPTTIFMFAGGGSQRPGMALELAEREPVFAAAVQEALSIIPGTERSDIERILMVAEPTASDFAAAERPSIALPALLITQYAMASLLRSWGVTPSAMIGHSMGEYTAALLSGVFTLEQALQLVSLRGRLFETLDKGGMLSVQLSESELRDVLPEELSTAAVNAPELTVASGPVPAIARLEEILREREISFSRVRIDVAAHSSMLGPILDEFRTFLRSLRLGSPSIPFVSNLTGTWIANSECVNAEYWVQHLRQTVQFAAGMSALLADPSRVFLEVGPGRTLATLARAQAGAAELPAITTMRAHDEPGASDQECALLALGALWAGGVKTDWTGLRSSSFGNRISLPTYPFERQRHWISPPVRGVAPGMATEQKPARLPLQEWFQTASWRPLVAPRSAAGAASQSEATALLIGDGSPFTTALREELARHFGGVLTVARPASRDQNAPGEYVIPDFSAQSFEKLLDTLNSEGRWPQFVFHTLQVADLPDDLSSAAELEERSFYSLVHYAQASGRVAAIGTAAAAQQQLIIVTSDACTVGTERPRGAWKALSRGLAPVIATEFLELNARLLDISIQMGPDTDAQQLASQVVREALHTGRPRVVALRGGTYWEEDFTDLSVTPPAEESDLALRKEGVYLITGGLGGLGLSIARHLAARYRARLVLAGRNAPENDMRSSDARIRREIEELESLGASVHTVRADIATTEGAALAVAEAQRRFGTLNGVFHLAGVLNDQLLQFRTDADSAAVLAPKVRGTLALHAALRNTPAELLVLFSSVSAVAGVAGQSDYAAANAFLNSFARANDGSTCRTLAIQWGTFKNLGMTADPFADQGTDKHPLRIRRLTPDPTQSISEVLLSTDSDWLVGEHQLADGTHLVPGTGYLEIVAAAFDPTADRAIQLRDVAFMAPVVVPPLAERAVRVLLDAQGAASNFVVVADEGGTWHQVAGGSVAYAASEPPLYDSPAVLRRRCGRPAAQRTGVPHPHLRLGDRWECVMEVGLGDGEALGSLALQERFRASDALFRLHPALLDMATACGLELIPGYDLASDFYVPLGYGSLTSYAPLPAEVWSHVRLIQGELDPREVAVFDITLLDAAGRVVADVKSYMMTRVTDTAAMLAATQRRRTVQLPRLTGEARTALPEEIVAHAISADEGCRALDLLLQQGTPACVSVGWLRVPDMIALLRHATRPPDPPAPVVKRLTGLPRIEEALRSHPAVRGAAAVARPDRTGADKVVCYVVLADGAHATVSELRRHVKGALQGGERAPSTFITLDRLPLASDGTPDYDFLPDPFGVADTHVAPRTDLEKAIAATWVEALGVPRVSVHDNFFDIGGHSLLAVRVVTRLDRQLGVRLSQATMVLQTLEQIAAECERQLTAGSTANSTG